MRRSKEILPDKVKKGVAPAMERLAILDGSQLYGVLATAADNQPYTSMVAYALTPDGKGVVFITPRKSLKFRSMLRNRRVSLLIDSRTNTPKDYLDAESITVLGDAIPIKRGGRWNNLAQVLTSKHPNLREVMDSPETRLILVEMSHCIHVTRFQTVSVCVQT